MPIEELMSRALDAVGEPDSPLIREVFDRLVETKLPTEPMSVQEVSELLDVSPHTLRYYERIGLVDGGAETMPERLEMLLEHRDTLRLQIRQLTLSLAATEYKIATYGGDTAP